MKNNIKFTIIASLLISGVNSYSSSRKDGSNGEMGGFLVVGVGLALGLGYYFYTKKNKINKVSGYRIKNAFVRVVPVSLKKEVKTEKRSKINVCLEGRIIEYYDSTKDDEVLKNFFEDIFPNRDNSSFLKFLFSSNYRKFYVRVINIVVDLPEKIGTLGLAKGKSLKSLFTVPEDYIKHGISKEESEVRDFIVTEMKEFLQQEGVSKEEIELFIQAFWKKNDLSIFFKNKK